MTEQGKHTPFEAVTEGNPGVAYIKQDDKIIATVVGGWDGGVDYGPAIDRARLIVRAVNSNQALVEFVENIRHRSLSWVPSDEVRLIHDQAEAALGRRSRVSSTSAAT